MNEGLHAQAGAGSVIVQIQGDGSIVNVNQPHLELTRRTGLSRRIGTDSETGNPIETDLIRPFARAIELVGREVELDSLRRWLRSEPPISIRVLTGESGIGKTRLALELAEEAAAKGWRAGFLTRQELARFLGQTHFTAWGWDAPVLAIVDYASASASALNAWLSQLVDHHAWEDASAGGVPPLRVLLLERHGMPGTGWWAETFRGGDAASPDLMLDPREPVALSRIDQPGQRREILKRTLARLGSELALPEGVDFERRLAELTWGGVPLLLMVAAVTAERDNFGAALALNSDALALNIARNELSRIRKVAMGSRVDPVLAPLVDHVVAVATLRQGLSKEAIHDVVKAEAAALEYELPYGPKPLREALVTALPAANGDMAAVEPDMIGEALLLLVWENGHRARAPVADDDDVVLSTIRRAHRADSTAVMETVIRTCQDYVIHGHCDPLGWLELVFRERADSEAVIELANAMPETTVELRELALEISRSATSLAGRFSRDHIDDVRVQAVYSGQLNNLSNRLSGLGLREEALAAVREAVDLHRRLAAGRPDAFRPDLAMSLNNLSNHLSGLGLREEALAAVREAVDLRRGLAADRPDAFRPDLATSLNNLSVHLSGLGLREEALAAVREAVDILRGLAADRPDAFRPDLAMSLNNLSNHLSELGLREEALAAVREAVDLRRGLAAGRPDAFRPGLAMSLNNLSNHLSGLGLREEALAAVREAVDILRGLAADRPDAFRPHLATSLNNLSNHLSELGLREEALAAVRESVDLRRGLAAGRPDAFRPGLATSLNNLSNRLSGLGLRAEALAAAREAVDILRGLAADRPDAFRPHLATSLNNLSNHLSGLGLREEALAAVRESVDIRRGLAADRPDAFRPDLATSLNNLSNHLSGLGLREEALAAVRESVDILRGLAADRPDAFRPDLAMSLNNLSVHLSGLGLREEALAAVREAVDLRRGLAADRPDAFRPDLAMSLNNLSNRLSGLGLREEALAAVREAVDLRRGLAADRPDAFRPDLAMSLNNLSNRLSGLGLREEAFHKAEDAVRTLSEPFLSAPAAFASRMAKIARNYKSRCAEVGRKPNSDLMAPIVETLGHVDEDCSG